MNRRTVLALTTVGLSAVALSAGDAMAQQRSLKDQLVGTWTLVSTEDTAANGTKRQPWGANPKGIHIFEAGGRYATLGGDSNRPKFRTASQPTTEELAAATRDYFANFGTWTVNEADKTLTRRYESALRPNNEGEDVKESVSLAGDALTLSRPVAGGTRNSVYRRAK
jgi:Lipocalin-like domain